MREAVAATGVAVTGGFHTPALLDLDAESVSLRGKTVKRSAKTSPAS